MLSEKPLPSRSLGVEGMLGMLGLSILLVAAVIWTATGPRAEKTDFAFTYMGATILHRGQADRLYDRDFQVQTRESLFVDPNPLLYQHPPFEAFLLSPLAKYPFRTVYLIWGLIGVVAWVLTLFALRPYCQWPQQDLAYICLWPLFAPLGVSLFQGQSSLLVLAFVSAGFVLLQKAKNFPAGLCFGLALFKPQVAVPLLLIFLLRKRWAVVAGGAVTGAVLGRLSVMAVGFRGLKQYASFLLNISSTPRDLSSGSAVDMGSIHGFLFAVLGHLIGPSAVSLTAVALSLLLLWFVAKRWGDKTGNLNLGFAAAVAASLAAGDHMFTHDFSPLMLALLLVGAQVSASEPVPGEERQIRRGLKFLLVFFWCFPIYFVLVAWHCLFLLAPLLVLFAMLALVVAKPRGQVVPANIVSASMVSNRY
jgi:hypothetical protein